MNYSTDFLSGLSINSSHVIKQFTRRGNLINAQFLYSEIARRLIDRLKYIRINPNMLLDAGCGVGNNIPLLFHIYPEVNYIGLDNCKNLLNYANKKFIPHGINSWLNKIFHRKQRNIRFVENDLSDTKLLPECLDMIWSNLSIHWHPQPDYVLAEWNRILKINGLVVFSCFGPETFSELRQAVQNAKLVTETYQFIDMHDFGDFLIKNGFVDPVINQETITLTYKTAKHLIRDVYALGGNPMKNRRKNLISRSWIEKLYSSLESQRNENNLIPLTIEIIYGNGWKAPINRTLDRNVYLNVNSIKRSYKKDSK